MGIPKYFRWITNKYSNLIFEKNNKSSLDFDEDVLLELENIDNLFLDANCLIHPCCRQILQDHPNLIDKHFDDYTNNINNIKNRKDVYSLLEKKMFDSVIVFIDNLYKFVNPKKMMYVAIDGVAPRAKMEQQRTRRYRSFKEREIIEKIHDKFKSKLPKYWDTNAITPGTTFMIKLTNYLKHTIPSKFPENIHLILSGPNTPGEGEHKIMDYLRENKNEDINCIYGLDADLIMLSLCQNHKIYLLREAVYFGKVKYDTLLYFSINNFKKDLYQDIVHEIGECDFEITTQVVIDYVFLCFLLGNDFLPHLVNLDINENSINSLLTIYVKLLSVRKKYLLEETTIDYNFLQQILNHIFNNEEKVLKNFQKRIDRKKIYHKHYDNKLDKELDQLRYYPIINKNKYLKLGYDDWREKYYKYYFNINNIQKSKNNVDDICSKYIEGLQWNIKYYLEGCSCWSWYYPYRAAPSLRELCQYLNNRIYKTDFQNDPPYLPLHQLSIVLPIKSHQLLPMDIKNYIADNKNNLLMYYPSDFKLDTLNKFWLHECEPIIPNTNDNMVIEAINSITLNDFENEKNTLVDNYVFNKPIVKRNVSLTIT